MAVSAGRWAAFRILRRVELEGGFAEDLLHSPLTGSLDRRDLGLAEELTLGVLRWQGALDGLLAEAAGRPVGKLDAEVRLALRLGLYQLWRFDRVPRRAAVSESVEIVKRARKVSAAGLVNAILRQAAEETLPERIPAEQCVPLWLVERWRRQFGDATAERLAQSTLRKPATFLRLNARFDIQVTLRRLAEEGVETAATELPFCRRAIAGRPVETACSQEGRIRLQDLGSQRVASLLEPQPGHSFLDLCAAPGGKTFQILEQSDCRGRVIACDLSAHRLKTMRRLATSAVDMLVLDATSPLPFSCRFDRILVDAPCSGTGTLARNPEIKWRLTPADLERLSALQCCILRQGLELLAPGGRLVYATCSLEVEENERVVEAVLSGPFQRVEQRMWLPGEHSGDGFCAFVITRRG